MRSAGAQPAASVSCCSGFSAHHALLLRRYTADTKHMLQCWFEEKPFDETFYIVREGKVAEQYSQK